jgi:adenosine deaminase
MAAINAENASAWQAMADQLSEQRPSVGRHVRVTAGKHQGKVGTVIRHQPSQYINAFRYASDAQAHLREMAGRFGFVCRVQAAATPEQFWVDADKVEVIPALPFPDDD